MKYALDELQEKAVNCTSQNTLIVAAPGSGKTTVIINRIIHKINQDDEVLLKIFKKRFKSS